MTHSGIASVTRHVWTRAAACSPRLEPLVAAFLLAWAVHPAVAQSPASASGAAPALDLRSVYATAADVAEGKRIAETTCSKCHGLSGISGKRGVPNIAGQRPPYLQLKLQAYQAGTRGGHEMDPAVKYLNDDGLVKVAAYYGTLEPAQPSASDLKKGPPSVPDPLAAGKAAAAACAGCHGEGGVTSMAGTPSLAGLDPKYFAAAMAAYKSGRRKNDVMKPLSASLGEADLKGLALYYALQKPSRASTPAPGDQAAGKAAAAACGGCHGETGVSATAGTPSIAGQDAQYHVAALHAYKDGSRADDTMKGVAGGLTDAQMKAVAAYFAAQQPRAPKVEKPLTLAEWVQRCDRCHGINGNSTDPRTPMLAGQRVEYLQKALHAYQSGTRKDSVMAAMSATLTEADMKGLATYYSHQRARAFVFVPVPAFSR